MKQLFHMLTEHRIYHFKSDKSERSAKNSGHLLGQQITGKYKPIKNTFYKK